MTPSSPRELHQALVKLHENKNHLIGYKVSASHVDVDLSERANNGFMFVSGTPDIRLKLRPSSAASVKMLLENLLAKPTPPSLGEATQLYCHLLASQASSGCKR